MKNYKICLFEDMGFSGFGPLVFTRPVWDLRCGALTLSEKILKQFDRKDFLFCLRNYLATSYSGKAGCAQYSSQGDHEQILFINGRLLIEQPAVEEVLKEDGDTLFCIKNIPAVLKLNGKSINDFSVNQDGLFTSGSLQNFREKQVEGKLMQYPWDLVKLTAEEISKDINRNFNGIENDSPKSRENLSCSNPDKLFRKGNVDICQGVLFETGVNKICLSDKVVIGPGVVIDARKGPVWIDEGAEIEASAVLTGPLYIGKKSIVRAGARLSDGTSLGPDCRVGGEVSRSVILGFSNKQHSGYLGNSYLGEWVNLGATTDNSDLKNNYRPVEVVLNKTKINTGDLHVGVIIADFCRTAIQTRLNSGAVIGVGCNLFGADFPSKNVPSFIWFGSDGYQEYRLDKAIETIRMVLPRRGQDLTDDFEMLLRNLFYQSQLKRDEFLKEMTSENN